MHFSLYWEILIIWLPTYIGIIFSDLVEYLNPSCDTLIACTLQTSRAKTKVVLDTW